MDNVIFKQLVSSLPFSFLILDKNLNVQYTNDHFCASFNYKPAEVIGINLEKLLNGRYQLDTLPFLLSGFRGMIKMVFYTKEGRPKPCMLNTHPLTSQKDNYIGLFFGYSYQSQSLLNNDAKDYGVKKVAESVEEVKKESNENGLGRLKHDLYASIRATSEYSNIFMQENANQVDDQGKHYIDRISDLTNKTKGLVDLLIKSSNTET